MVEKDLEFARQAIIAGKTPLITRRYWRSRLFWVIAWFFLGVLLCFSFFSGLSWEFWKGVLIVSPVFLLLIMLRRMFATSPNRDLGIIVAALAILGIAAINGSAHAGLPLEKHLPVNLIKAAEIPAK